jgi:hypothetical protein
VTVSLSLSLSACVCVCVCVCAGEVALRVPGGPAGAGAGAVEEPGAPPVVAAHPGLRQGLERGGLPLERGREGGREGERDRDYSCDRMNGAGRLTRLLPPHVACLCHSTICPFCKGHLYVCIHLYLFYEESFFCCYCVGVDAMIVGYHCMMCRAYYTSEMAVVQHYFIIILLGLH